MSAKCVKTAERNKENNLHVECTVPQEKKTSELEIYPLKIVYTLKIRDVTQNPKCESP